ncbi:MAG: hypothetical protein K2Y23_04035 [Cyanobacteria bacterium]|nr:hypothetical protein [Cyanobacteriota bacterium]
MRAPLAALLASVASSVLLASCIGIYPVTVATRMPADLDMTPYSRLLVAGFNGTAIDDVDTNAETVRLLRSQLRAVRSLTIVNAAAIPVTDMLFVDASFWRRIGEEYRQPLVLTGTVSLSTERRTATQYRDRETFDDEGRRRTDATRSAVDVETRVLRARLLYIDGRTGAIIHADTFQEQTSYAPTQNVPALSSYFELIGRVVPAVLGTVSDHSVVGSRALLR